MIMMTCGQRGWGEWCLPWSWLWSRPCSPRSKAATMFVFIHIWILRAYLSFNMRVLLMLQQVLCPVHILLPVRHISAKNSPKKSFYLIATSSASLGRIPFWTSMSAHIGGETITYGEGLEETINLSLSLPLTDNSQIYIWWDHQDIIDSRWHWQIIHIYLYIGWDPHHFIEMGLTTDQWRQYSHSQRRSWAPICREGRHNQCWRGSAAFQ